MTKHKVRLVWLLPRVYTEVRVITWRGFRKDIVFSTLKNIQNLVPSTIGMVR
jgi:hypothetical protein